MERHLMAELKTWRNEPHRKPLLVRGARQVGKSYLLREFGRTHFPDFVELNFEMNPELSSIFAQNLDPVRLVRDLIIFSGRRIEKGSTLLFLDEIQACPQALVALRYFYEQMPELHIVAAGSLIEFAIEQIGLPVGRVETVYLYPMGFLEFLQAAGETVLLALLVGHDLHASLPGVAHQKLLGLLGQYFAVGGMPEAVRTWFEGQDLTRVHDVHNTLIETYRADFARYARRAQLKYLERVFQAVPRLLGQKFVFAHADPDAKSRDLKAAFSLLEKAGVVHAVCHTSANGLPLGAELNDKVFKGLFLDIALAQTVLGMPKGDWVLQPAAQLVNRGAIAEAFVGQEMLACGLPRRKQQLCYWNREKAGSQAEIDYVVELGHEVIPVEVKSGPKGRLRSMDAFLAAKPNTPYGIHLSAENFTRSERIKGIPLYSTYRLCS